MIHDMSDYAYNQYCWIRIIIMQNTYLKSDLLKLIDGSHDPENCFEYEAERNILINRFTGVMYKLPEITFERSSMRTLKDEE